MAKKKLGGKERYVRRMKELHGCTRATALGWWHKMQVRRKQSGVMWTTHWELPTLEQVRALHRRLGKG